MFFQYISTTHQPHCYTKKWRVSSAYLSLLEYAKWLLFIHRLDGIDFLWHLRSLATNPKELPQLLALLLSFFTVLFYWCRSYTDKYSSTKFSTVGSPFSLRNNKCEFWIFLIVCNKVLLSHVINNHISMNETSRTFFFSSTSFL